MHGLTLARFVVRTIDWSALAIVGLGALVVVVLVGRLDVAALAPTTRLCGGALAAAVALTTRDAARELLSAVPTSRRRRCGYRSVLVIGPALVATAALTVAAGLAASGPRPAPLAALPAALALMTTGIAVASVVGRSHPAVSAECGAIIAVVWAAAPTLAPASGAPLASLWAEHPWWVVVAALVVAGWALRG